MTTPQRATDFVQSLERGLAVVQAFDAIGDALTPSEVATETQLTRAAARRFLLTLAGLGYVRSDGRSFRLTPRVLELGRAYLAGLALPRLALPHLRAFVADVRESSSLAVLDGKDVVYIGHVQGDRVLSVAATVGGRDPAHATSLGRVLLAAQSDDLLEDYFASADLRAYTERSIVDAAALRAELERVRAQGFALVDEEFEDGLRAVAAPVRAPDGAVVAAANVGAHASRWTTAEIREELLPKLLETTAAIEAALAARAAPEPPGRRPDAATAPARGTDFVQSLERGFAVIRSFSDGSAALTLSEVAAATGLTRAAARRFLLTLNELGYVAVDGRTFRLTPRVLELGRSYLARLTLPDLVQPHLQQLVAVTEESSSFATLDGDEILYVAHESAQRVLAVSVAIGARDPAWATALGRVLLAAEDEAARERLLADARLVRFTKRTIVDRRALARELQRIRAQGYAVVDEEFEEGLRVVAVPVEDGGGRVAGAVNLSMHAMRRSVDEIVAELLPALRAAAAGISDDLAAAGR